jgi:phosphatidylserine/phosphatidylglycerophosphate/cardiolipin synthase-like enzyme
MGLDTMSNILISIVLLALSNIAYGANVSVCFTPGGACTDKIVHNIDTAKVSVYMQAYIFTSKPIEAAVLRAKARGLDVQIILDSSNFVGFVPELKAAHIPVYEDYRPAIAHNKVIIIDTCKVLTGSFNFTNAAQLRNAENSIEIIDCDVGRQYTDYFTSRKEVSRSWEEI